MFSIFQNRFSFDCFSNNAMNSSRDNNNMTTSSSGNRERKSVSRCHSDSSTITAKTEQLNNDFVNRSVESVTIPSTKSQQQQLLKLSFLNSPNSPINSKEAKKIVSRQFAISTDSSFEDLNNISQSLIDNSMESINDDFKELKVDKIEIKSESEPEPAEQETPMANKIAMLQEQLKRIKQESIDVDNYEFTVKVEETSPIKIPDTPSPKVKKEKADISEILKNMHDLSLKGKDDEVRRQLAKLSELLSSNNTESKTTIQVQPMIREDTFEIDKNSGKRIYNKNLIRPNQQQQQTPVKKTTTTNQTEDLLEKIQALVLNRDNVEFQAVQVGDSTTSQPIVVLVPKDLSTPAKNSRVSNFGTAHKPTSVVRALDSRKIATPRNSNVSSNAAPRHSFTQPRPVGQTKHPYEQKLSNVRQNVRKNLDSKMNDGSPKDSKVSKSSKPTATVAAAKVQRSSSFNSTTKQRPSTVCSDKVPNQTRIKSSASMKQPSAVVKPRTITTTTTSKNGNNEIRRPKKFTSNDQGSLV